MIIKLKVLKFNLQFNNYYRTVVLLNNLFLLNSSLKEYSRLVMN